MNLLQRLKANEPTAFDVLYAQTQKSVFYAIYFVVKNRDVAEDLMQETYLDLLEKMHRFDESMDLSAYLVTCAKNKAINYYNHHKREVEYLGVLESYSYSEDTNLDSGLLDQVRKILDPKECEVFLLHVIGEYSFKEISKMTKIPVGTLTWMYQESRKKLQKVLGEV